MSGQFRDGILLGLPWFTTLPWLSLQSLATRKACSISLCSAPSNLESTLTQDAVTETNHFQLSPEINHINPPTNGYDSK